MKIERIREGMFVRTTAGEKLGKVISTGAETFIVEKGLLSPKDYELRHEYISEIRDDEIIYSLEKHSLRAGRGEGVVGGTAKAGTMPAGASTSAQGSGERLGLVAGERKAGSGPADRVLADKDEARIALLEEQLALEKVSKEVGTVRIHKGVVSEERQVTVPILREEVVIEHIPGDPARTASSEGAFRDQTIDVPVHEEDFRVVKRPVVREEVRVRRVNREEQRTASATVRHEELDVEDSTRRSVADIKEGERKMSPTPTGKDKREL